MTPHTTAPLLCAVAMPMELGDFRRRLVPLDDDGRLFAVCGNPLVRVALIGVGPHASAERLEERVAQARPGAVVSVGYCGALVGSLQLGDVVLPDRLTSTHPTDRHRHHAHVDEPLHRWLVDSLASRIPTTSPATLFTSDHAVFNRPERRLLHQRHGAHVVDMEAAELARVCCRHGVPFAAVKVVSDTSESELPAGILGALGRSGFGLLRYLHRPRTFMHAGKVLLGVIRGRHVLGAALRILERSAGRLDLPAPVDR